jgi:hypothetical protein
MNASATRTAHRLPSAKGPARPHAAILPRRAKEAASRKALAAGPSPVPTRGAVRLDIANAQPAVVMGITLKIWDGMTEIAYYPELADYAAALAASYSGQRRLADLLDSLDAQTKAARLAQLAETANARDILKICARACESHDTSDEALASVGWELRKGRSPSQLRKTHPPPHRLPRRDDRPLGPRPQLPLLRTPSRRAARPSRIAAIGNRRYCRTVWSL